MLFHKEKTYPLTIEGITKFNKDIEKEEMKNNNKLSNAVSNILFWTIIWLLIYFKKVPLNTLTNIFACTVTSKTVRFLIN